MLSRCFLDFSVGVGAFVIGLSQISSFFSFYVTTSSSTVYMIVYSFTDSVLTNLFSLFYSIFT